MISQPFPAFDLPAYPNTRASLAQTWTVVHFLHASFSAVCATELSALSQLEHTPVISLCPDSMLSLIAWLDLELTKIGVNASALTIASDAGTDLRQQLDLAANARAVFIVDADGIIQAEIRQPAAVGISIGEVGRILQALRYAYETAGECTPTDWQPGRPGLPPGASNIGKTWTVWPTVDRDSPL